MASDRPGSRGQPQQAGKGEAPDRILDRIFDRLIDRLTDADIPEGLPELLGELDTWVRERLDCFPPTGPATRSDPDQTRALESVFFRVSRFNQRLTSRILQHTIQHLEREKKLSPPLPFCWISLGSDARGEQVIRTDQDNALIYADPVPGREKEAANYFKRLAGRTNQILDRLGFDLCPGNVMAANPQWCRSLSQWLAALDDWVGSSDPMAVRHLTILLDFKAVFGDQRLAAMLQTRVFRAFDTHPSASHFLVRDDRLFAPPKKLFNRIRTRRVKGCRACFNLKTQAIAHIVNGARLFAVNHHIRQPATLKRLEHLASDGVFSDKETRAYAQAFVFLTRLKIRRHLAGAPQGSTNPGPNRIDVAALDEEERRALGHSLDAVAGFQKKMAAAYNQNWMNFFN